MSIQERLKRDYFGPSRYAQYKAVLQKALKNGFHFVTLKEFDVTKTKQVILRHDIDSDIGIAKKMFAIEKSLIGLIVGNKGATISELQRRTGTTIHIAKEGDAKHPDLRNVIITGDPKNVLEAKRQVLLIADVPLALLFHF